MDGNKTTTAEAAHFKFSLDYNRKYHAGQMGAVRSAFSDAAHMCDAIAADILKAGTRGTRVKKDAVLQAAALKHAGDAIWRVHEELGETQ